MPKRTKEDNSGWPEHPKDTKEQQRLFSEKMAGKRFADVLLKSDRKVIPWDLVHKAKRTYEWFILRLGHVF